jgi:ribosomal protein L37E
MGRRWPKNHVHVCELCGQHAVPHPQAYCDACWESMRRYNQHSRYGRDTLTIRQLHSLRQRVALELPLFEGGRICV